MFPHKNYWITESRLLFDEGRAVLERRSSLAITLVATCKPTENLSILLGGNTELATQGLSHYEKPFITIWGSNDFGNLGSCEAQQYLIDLVPGAEGQDHIRLPEASHFLQDDQGVEIANRLVEFYQLK